MTVDGHGDWMLNRPAFKSRTYTAWWWSVGPALAAVGVRDEYPESPWPPEPCSFDVTPTMAHWDLFGVMLPMYRVTCKQHGELVLTGPDCPLALANSTSDPMHHIRAHVRELRRHFDRWNATVYEVKS